MSIKTEKELYNHWRTKHVSQFKSRTLSLALVKMNDMGYIDDDQLELLLENPKLAYQSPALAEVVHESLCNDVVHCDLGNNGSIEPFTKIHNHQKKNVYQKSRRWSKLGEVLRKLKNNICSTCEFEYHDWELHAHHIDEEYPNLYRERIVDLDTKCKVCHGNGHNWMYKNGLNAIFSRNYSI